MESWCIAVLCRRRNAKRENLPQLTTSRNAIVPWFGRTLTVAVGATASMTLTQENITLEVFDNLRCNHDGPPTNQRLQIFGQNKLEEEDTKFMGHGGRRHHARQRMFCMLLPRFWCRWCVALLPP